MKGNVNVTVIEEKILPIFINYFLCTYGYVIVGVLLIAINIPTSLIVFTYKALRSAYNIIMRNEYNLRNSFIKEKKMRQKIRRKFLLAKRKTTMK